MSSFYDDASLVMIPSCYKVSTVLCEKPTDGSGDLTFTRTGDTATRVNSSGLVEKVRTNLLTRSQEFDNIAWTKDRTTVTANATTAPDGTTTADKVVDTLQGANAYRIYNGVTLSAISYSASFYVKAAEYSWVYIRIGNSLRVWFNVSTGVVGTNDFGITGVIQSAGNGWYRCTAIIATATAGGGFSLLGLTNANGVETYTPSTGGQGVFVWGAQLETTDFGATPYIPTTTAAVSVGPVANLPRLDYLGSTCGKLLLEPQRTNILLFSEQFNNGAWSLDGDGVGQSLTANFAISPDGYQNADRLQLNKTGGTFSRIRQSKTGANTYTFSVYMKSNTGVSQNVGLRLDTTGTNNVVTTTWQRFTLTATVGTPQAQILLFDSIVGNDEIADILIWGAQLEVGSFATSYIPTLAASATRSAESSSSANISSLFGATEGSFYVQLTHDGRNTNNAIPVFLRSSINGNFNRATYLQFGATNLTLNVYDAGTLQAAISGGTYTNGQTLKVAFAYKANDFALYVNGVQLGTDTSGAISSSLSFIDFGSYMLAQSTFQYDGKVSQALLFKTRLTNAQLAELTTL